MAQSIIETILCDIAYELFYHYTKDGNKDKMYSLMCVAQKTDPISSCTNSWKAEVAINAILGIYGEKAFFPSINNFCHMQNMKQFGCDSRAVKIFMMVKYLKSINTDQMVTNNALIRLSDEIADNMELAWNIIELNVENLQKINIIESVFPFSNRLQRFLCEKLLQRIPEKMERALIAEYAVAFDYVEVHKNTVDPSANEIEFFDWLDELKTKFTAIQEAHCFVKLHEQICKIENFRAELARSYVDQTVIQE